MSAFKECPFCGGAGHMSTEHDADGMVWHYVSCRKCGARTRGKWLSSSENDCLLHREEVRDEWQQRPPAGWRPIETAPEFTEVLCYRPDQGVFISQLTTPDGIVPDDELQNFPDDFKEWWNGEWGWQEGDLRPTHWMPLPEGPSAAASSPAPEQQGGGNTDGMKGPEHG